MTVETKDNESDLQKRVVKPERIEIEERGGYEILVVENHIGTEYTTFNDNFMQEVPAEKEKYLEKKWELLFTVTDKGYINFHGFTQPVPDADLPEEEVDPAEYNQEFGSRQERIAWQNAQQHASRIVAAVIGKTEKDELSQERIKDWLDYWTKQFYHHAENREWTD